MHDRFLSCYLFFLHDYVFCLSAHMESSPFVYDWVCACTPTWMCFFFFQVLRENKKILFVIDIKLSHHSLCLVWKINGTFKSNIQMRILYYVLHTVYVWKWILHTVCINASVCVHLLMHACLCMCVHNRMIVSITNEYPIN